MPSLVCTRTRVASKCVRGIGSHAAAKVGSSGSRSWLRSIAVIFTSEAGWSGRLELGAGIARGWRGVERIARQIACSKHVADLRQAIQAGANGGQDRLAVVPVDEIGISGLGVHPHCGDEQQLVALIRGDVPA